MKMYGHTEKIIIGKRIVPNGQVLGVQGQPTFKLKRGQIIEVLETDKYGKGLVRIDGKEFWMWSKIIDQCSNAIKGVQMFRDVYNPALNEMLSKKVRRTGPVAEIIVDYYEGEED